MFNFVGKNKRLLQFFLALIIVPVFALFGIESYQGFVGAGGAVAEVAGEPISEQEFERALADQRDRLRNAFGGKIDAAMFDTPDARKELLESLVRRRLLLDYAYRHKMFASDQQIREFVASYPAFQEDGRFSRERYQALLRAQNMSPAGFESQLRADIALEQLSAGVAQSAFVSDTMARRFAIARSETREVERTLITAGEHAGKVNVTTEEIQAYYDNNPKEFETPEQVRAAYVVLSRDAIAARETVSDEEVRQQYEARVAPQAKAREEARAKAQMVLDEVRKDPSKFAELAKQYSQDPGSAEQGGDLGFFARGAMVKPFEDAVFKLKPGEIAPLVESDFGFHIIQLTEVKPGVREERRARHILLNAPSAGKDSTTARAEIAEELKRQRVSRKFPEAAEAFSNLAYEQPDSLEPLAERFNLKIEESNGWLSRSAGRPPLDNPRLLEALFSAEAIQGKQNTEAIEVAPGQLLAARVIDHKAASKRPLEDVRDEIRKTLTERKAVELAQQAGEEKLKALRNGESAGLSWNAPKNVSRENPADFDAQALIAVFKVSGSKLPAYTGVSTSAGYAIYRISKVNTPAQIEQQRQRAAAYALGQINARQDLQGFVNGLRDHADVEINEEKMLKVGNRGQ
ncbi:MAG TPA: SurA N-terminal domain-containing protein [Burkholderiales bacterium]